MDPLTLAAMIPALHSAGWQVHSVIASVQFIQVYGTYDVPNAFTASVVKNHFYNKSLWAEEDLARRTKVSDSEIVQNKRNIDGFNQKRNDAIREIDEALNVMWLSNVEPLHNDARLSSETPGQMIDRLSIISLKIHASLELGLLDRVKALDEQKIDLLNCLERLLTGYLNGSEYFKTYHAHKLYNDASTNPALIKENS